MSKERRTFDRDFKINAVVKGKDFFVCQLPK